LKNGRISDFHGLVTLTLTSDRIHTAYRHASLVDLYLHIKNFIEIEETLWTDGRTDGQTFETHCVIRSTRRSRHNDQYPDTVNYLLPMAKNIHTANVQDVETEFCCLRPKGPAAGWGA